MEFSPRFMFFRNLKKISRKVAKIEKIEAKAAMSLYHMESVMLATTMS